jgi:O-antigen/teichoic acid export membrane protein
MIKYFKSLKVRYMRKESFSVHVLTLMTGTAIAQALPIAVAPILTRLYAPDSFGLLALYMSIVSVISIVSTARYEHAIMLPRDDEDALNIFTLSFVILIFVTCFTLLFVLLFKNKVGGFLKSSDINNWLYLVPVSIFLTGAFQLLNYWTVREKKFKRLAFNKVFQSGSIAGIQLVGGYAPPGSGGLVLGQVLGQGLGTGMLGYKVWADVKSRMKCVHYQQMIKQARRYRKFPFYSLIASFINQSANQVPIFLISGFFGLSTAGFFSLPQRILAAPISLIGNSIRDVFRERASRDYRTIGNCRDIYVKTFKSLLFVSVIPFAFLFFTSPVLVPFIFGSNWRIAGEYAQILSVMYFIDFIATPLSYVLYIAEKQNVDLVWQIFLLLFTIASFLAAGYFKSVKIGLVCFSFSYSFLYIFYILLSYKYACGAGVAQSST